MVTISGAAQRVATMLALVVLVTLQADAEPTPSNEDTTQPSSPQLEELHNMQLLMEKELQVIQRQLEDIRTMLEAKPGSPEHLMPLPTELSIDKAITRGSINAPLVIVEFSDFQCPYCGRYARETFALIDQDFIATGKVRYVFRNLPLQRIHADAFQAAEAATCANAQGKFWEMRERLFAHQDALSSSDLADHAAAIGADRSRFAACQAGQSAETVRADVALARAAGVTSTPTFYFGTMTANGKVKVVQKLSGALPYATFKSTIEELLVPAMH